MFSNLGAYIGDVLELIYPYPKGSIPTPNVSSPETLVSSISHSSLDLRDLQPIPELKINREGLGYSETYERIISRNEINDKIVIDILKQR